MIWYSCSSLEFWPHGSNFKASRIRKAHVEDRQPSPLSVFLSSETWAYSAALLQFSSSFTHRCTNLKPRTSRLSSDHNTHLHVFCNDRPQWSCFIINSVLKCSVRLNAVALQFLQLKFNIPILILQPLLPLKLYLLVILSFICLNISEWLFDVWIF